jgi:hypothetical protein
MSIAEKKQEILQLIEQLQPGSAPLPVSQRESRVPSRSIGSRISRRKQELSDIRVKRDKLGLELLEERVLTICQSLEQRIARIEEILSNRATAARVQQLRGPESGTEIAEDSLDMEPDIGQLGGFGITATAGAEPEAAQPTPGATKGDSGHTLSGAIEEGVLADILQFISTNGKTGAFVVTYSGQEITLFFREGQICHALAGEMDGENALFAAMAAESGRFHFDETDEIPEENTIDGNTQFLILEALRQIDESRGGQ